MRRLFLPLFVPIVLSLMVFGCKKDKDETNIAVQDIRTSVYSFTISGDFEGEYEISEANAEGVTGGLSGVYYSDLNEFALGIAYSGLSDDGTWGLGLYAEMSSLVPGNYAFGDVDSGTSYFGFANDSTSVSLSVDSGSLNITSVEQTSVPIPGGVSGRYINGTFSLEMSNEENETATAQGQIVNGWIVVY